MKKSNFALIIILTAVNIITGNISAQDIYKITYKFSEKDNTNSKTFTLNRSNNDYLIEGVDKYGNNVKMYVKKDERKIYTVTSNSAVTIGTRHIGIECSYIGMQWGVYLLDLDKCEFLLQMATAAGSSVVAGKDCTIYNVMQQGDLRTDYYIYNNQISLKMTSPSTTIEAVSFQDNPSFPADEFTLPAIEWTDN